jgi:hypothetical protein
MGVVEPPTIHNCGHSHHSSSLFSPGTDLMSHNVGDFKLITSDLREGISSRFVRRFVPLKADQFHISGSSERFTEPCCPPQPFNVSNMAFVRSTDVEVPSRYLTSRV